MREVGRDEFNNLNERVEILENKYVAATDVTSSELLGLRLRLQEGLNAIRVDFDERFTQVDARFEQVDARFAQVDARFERVDERFAQMDLRFEEAAVDRQGLSDGLSLVASELQTQGRVLAQVLAKLDEL